VRDEVILGGQWRLRGIVDLVERRRGGPGLRVTDHKTGRNWTLANLVVGKGETLQPVLYGLAIEQLLGARVVESRLSYCTRVGEFAERVVTMSEPARRRGLEVLELIDRSIARGFLPPAPREKACASCDFRPVCGPNEERRLKDKDSRAIEELQTLRGWP
jgi:CRISPR/Cas system-associated exonuclease Cas4 (RecB family)